MRESRKKRTETQKRILKALIDNDLNLADVAKLHGHTNANVSLHLLRENEYYFKEAIKLAEKQHKQTV